MKRSLLIGFLAGLKFLLAQNSFNPQDVSIRSVQYSGLGCPKDSMSYVLSEDASAFTLLYDNFVVQGGLKACTIDIKFQVPEGWSYSLYSLDHRGYADLQEKDVAVLKTHYKFAGQHAQIGNFELKGPFSDDYFHRTLTSTKETPWSNCKKNNNELLRIQTSIRVNGAGTMTVDSTDGELKQLYGITWRRCSQPRNIIATGAGEGGGPHIKKYFLEPLQEEKALMAYDVNFRGGVRGALGDINADGIADLITGAGPGGGPHVKVFDGSSGQLLYSFMAYNSKFSGGVFVASGDLDGDGYDDIITGAGSGGGPHVIAFSGVDSHPLTEFFAYDLKFTGGVTVASADVDGDGYDDIITGAGSGGGAHVRVFRLNGTEIKGFLSHPTSYTSGIYVASGDLNGDGRAEIITGNMLGKSEVRIFDGKSFKLLRNFNAYDNNFLGGVRVSVTRIGGSTKTLGILTGAGPGGGPHVKLFHPTTLKELYSFMAYDPKFSGGVFVAGF